MTTYKGISGRRRRLPRLSLLAATMLAGLPMAVAPAAAAANDWTGAQSGDWSDGQNWSTNAAPTNTDTATVDGPDSTISGGAAADRVFIAAAANGVLNVNGATAQLGVTGSLLSGTGARGILNVVGTGKVQLGDKLILGDTAGSVGLATVGGVGSTLEATGDIWIGHNGSGSLAVENGGAITAAGKVILGLNGGSSGLLQLAGSGSKLDIASELWVGENASSILTITGGASVSDMRGALATNSGTANGIVLVDGPGSTWANSDTLRIGVLGNGSLTILHGGAVFSDSADIAFGAKSISGVEVKGQDSAFAVANTLNAGQAGEGTLSILEGGTVTSKYGNIGTSPGSKGHVLVDGAGSAWAMGVGLTVGAWSAGDLTISNQGKVTDNYGFIGNVASGSGSVVVDGAGASWVNSQDIQVGVSGAGSLTLKNGGAASAGMPVRVAVDAGSSGEVDIGGGLSGPAAAPGTLDAPALVFGAGSGLLTFNHTADNYVFAAAISGIGGINQIAGTTILTGGSSGFAGETSVAGGTLVVNGTLGGEVDVGAHGRLQGSGTVGSPTGATFIAGTVAPGNSIGTLHVGGDVTFATGSVYEVEVDAAGASDKLEASGAAAINGGTVKVLAGAGNYAPATTYTILTAADGRTGTFGGVTSNLAFLTPSLDYDATHVTLTLTRNNTGFTNVGVTRNQIATGGGVESQAGGAVYNAVLGLTTPQARAAFDVLSGEIHASVRGQLIEDSRFLRDAVDERLRAAFAALGASAAPVLAYGADDTPVAVAPDHAGPVVWSYGFGSRGSVDSDDNAASLERSTGGLLIGADGLVGDWRVGLLTGYSRANFRDDGRASSGSRDSYHLGLYAGSVWGVSGGELALRSGAAVSSHDIDTSRAAAFSGFSETLEGSYRARTAQAFSELGYSVKAARVDLEPFANLAYVNLSADGFKETGGAAAIAVRERTSGVTFTTLGLHAAADLPLGGLTATLRSTLGWRHAYGDVTPLATAAFAGGAAFTVAGVPVARDAAVVEAGLDLPLAPAASLRVAYGGQFGSGLSDHGVKATLDWKF
ncbi:outer membrane autotransporter protein [Mesorhizobium soli]|uniref:autotransporter outer membrane beta-barrel domain-containing protein n=1 Tax=Pseudaminobacter soli (ex Li et al. 2025) TaxID=1295366 RepID=UPI0024753111|nr:autotransporter domain-containing protein [Mesorhizobium soli]MDH6234639.1 outer membrane autotransporter protein [Mesorhizobium soli]